MTANQNEIGRITELLATNQELAGKINERDQK